MAEPGKISWSLRSSVALIFSDCHSLYNCVLHAIIVHVDRPPTDQPIDQRRRESSPVDTFPQPAIHASNITSGLNKCCKPVLLCRVGETIDEAHRTV